jgi:GntR family transcriptional regulator
MSNNPSKDKYSINPISNTSITSVVIEKIQLAISNGTFEPGERIPSEPKLASQLGVSRNTVREAINNLVEKGLLYKKRGIGTFITAQSPKIIKANLAAALGTSQLIKNQDKTPGQKNFIWREEIPPDDILKYLELLPGDTVMHISRLRTANGIPFSQSEEYIPIGFPNMSYDFSDKGKRKNWSLYNYFSEFGHEVNSVVTHVHAISADEELSYKLNINTNEAILKLEQTHYSNISVKPILHATNYHNDRKIDLMILRTGLSET